MNHPPTKVSRRQVLLGGLAAGSTLIVLRGTSAAHGGSVDGESANEAMGAVATRGASGAPIMVRVDNELVEVSPVGFGEGWELDAGDHVVVNLDNKTVWPHLRIVDPRTRTFSTVNDDPASERPFSSRGAA